jgi:hypothetical protein
MRHRLRAVGRTVLTIVLAHWSLSASAAAPAERPRPARRPPRRPTCSKSSASASPSTSTARASCGTPCRRATPSRRSARWIPTSIPIRPATSWGRRRGLRLRAGERRRRPADVLGRPSFYASNPPRIRIALLPTQTHQSESWVAPTPTACR